MTKILIDGYKLKDLHSGLGQFSLNFINSFLSKKPESYKIKLFVPKEFDSSILLKKPENFLFANGLKRIFPGLNQSYSLWHSLNQFPSFHPNKRTPWLLTIHDLNFLTEKNSKKSKIYTEKLQKDIDRADFLTTISFFAKKQIEENLNVQGKEIHVIHNGIASIKDETTEKPKFIADEKFFFTIGILNKKKNFHVLIPLMRHFEDFKLIIAGNKDTAYGKEIENMIEYLGLGSKVILSGKITNAERNWLYRNCEAFLFPSLAEGFGMPPVEAMKVGKPVFLSKFSSLPEIGGKLAYYFDNFDEIEMRNLIQTKLAEFHSNQPGNSNALIEYSTRFNWDNCINEYLKLYSEILS